MLRIRRVRRYRRAKYPRGAYRRRRRKAAATVAKGGASSLLLLALSEACGGRGGGTVGPPPVMPPMVTEYEARQIINRVFLEKGIALQADFPLVFRWAQDSLAFNVDGFNEALQVGYEYQSPEEDPPALSPEVQSALSAASDASGPYVQVVGGVNRDGNPEAVLEAEILAFIEKLKGLGVI